MFEQRITLTRYLLEEQQRHGAGRATGSFSGLINALTTAMKVISNQVNKGALVGALGNAGTGENVQGEVQKKLDVVANQAILRECEWGGHLTAMVSEEMEDLYVIADKAARGKYLLAFDPLDGSSNTDINISVGTIFSVLHAPDSSAEPALADFLQPGARQVCAGFAVYGPATMLVLTTGHGVDGFTLDRDIGAFILTHPQMRIPEDTHEFAINASNERFWDPPVHRYVEECLAGASGPRGKDFNMRWIASLVAETFRILTRGGIFMYPRDNRDALKPGRLRLLYEANPVAFIVEQAGGAASTGRGRIMDVVPEAAHQRVPLVFGSKNEVARIERYHAEYALGLDAAPVSPLFNTRTLFSRH